MNPATCEIRILRAIATALGPMPMSWSLLREAADLELAFWNAATCSIGTPT